MNPHNIICLLLHLQFDTTIAPSLAEILVSSSLIHFPKFLKPSLISFPYFSSSDWCKHNCASWTRWGTLLTVMTYDGHDCLPFCPTSQSRF
ncbi:uncharacterized protein F5147DRAFT_686589 [Suillus discolor]|uniref:Secreted protein n=1 Tax=Suillus discolor TaxID=1912936 RepID=A0A9P7FB15_9AGAM|nr:uncharacterized protein F5147DRAFT_686589 [Suillus discolor]KAG2111166.1 hypothetical protein F5147DRAFT_686589 [Suillus discolor]